MSSMVEDPIQKLNLFGCMQCAICSGSCPISLKFDGFNIRRIIRKAVFSRELPKLSENEVWGCTTCGTCMIRCPRDLKPFETVLEIRSKLIEEGGIPPTIRDALESVYKHGNPWGRIRDKRSEWAEDLNIEKPKEGETVPLLYFVCCSVAYDPRAQSIGRALVNIFRKTGLNFKTFGNEENCCGNEVYHMGEKGLFEILVEDNLNLFNQYNIELMVTSSPHCYNAFKNLYTGINFEVKHYTQLLSDLIDKGKLKFSKSIEKVVTYHDPCFLGKRNNIYDEPRKIIESVPGVKFVELILTRSQSLCCEGGGGRMWFDLPNGRLAERRIEEASEVGAEIILTSCPFCLINLEDAVKTTGKEDVIRVMDIAEFVSEAL